MDERDRLIMAVSQMLEGYGRTATEVQIGAYLFVLEGVNVNLALGAMRTIMRSGREHPPTPGQVYQAAVCGGDVDRRANEAWDVYEAAQKRVSGEYGVDFEDGIINAVVRCHGGWNRCCLLPDEDFHVWHKKSWIASYKRLATSDVSPERTAGIRGMLPDDFVGEIVKRIESPYVPAVLSIGMNYTRRSLTVDEQIDNYQCIIAIKRSDA